MKRAVVALIVFARAAHATPWISAPSDWNADDERSKALVASMANVAHFGAEQAVFEARVYAPAEPGIALFITHASALVPADRDRAIRAEVDQFHRASQRAQLVGSGISEDGWQERVDPDKLQVEASLTWRDAEAHTVETSRLVIAGTADRLIAVTGECIARDDVAIGLIKACTAALATLDPVVKIRVALTLAPTGSEPPAKVDSTTHADQPTMQDGSRAVVPPMTIPPEQPQPDRRPVYVGAGVVMLAAIFWWNRRRRERFEREDEAKEEGLDER